jgi:hypothetical protein
VRHGPEVARRSGPSGRSGRLGGAPWRLAVLAALAALIVGVGVPVGIGLADHHGRSAHLASGSKPTSGKEPEHAIDTARIVGPLVPKSGAYLGAYVQPTNYSAQGQVSAVKSFQRSIGHALDLVHVYHPWTEPFPSAADISFVHNDKVLLLTWGGTPDTRQIIAGDYDQLITERAEAVKQLHRPILMEFRHEMDRPNLQWAVHGPADYIKAWDHIRAIFTKVGATNVGWVWCPTGYGFQIGRAQAFYPGNSEVDWVCADVYTVAPHQSLQQAATPFLQWAAHTGKPIIIGEFADNGPSTEWASWLAAAGRFVRKHPQIKAIAYFDATGKDSNGNPFSYWLSSNVSALKAFGRLAGARYFRPAVPRS